MICKQYQPSVDSLIIRIGFEKIFEPSLVKYYTFLENNMNTDCLIIKTTSDLHVIRNSVRNKENLE